MAGYGPGPDLEVSVFILDHVVLVSNHMVFDPVVLVSNHLVQDHVILVSNHMVLDPVALVSNHAVFGLGPCGLDYNTEVDKRKEETRWYLLTYA